MIKVVDLFAGPGGLGEGFSSFVRDEKPRFQLALSIEKDAYAHETLLFRSFYRQVRAELPEVAEKFHRREISRADMFAKYSEFSEVARAEAVKLELSPHSASEVRHLVSSIARDDSDWVLVGGPPCQAYSLIGRVKNRSIEGYSAEDDPRQTLYLEYLQLLADHAPPVFVMENVKGLLSATLNSNLIFDKILADLSNPSNAIRREGRTGSRQRPRYRLYPFTDTGSLIPGPQDFVVRAENFGVPQSRHRILVLGVRDDWSNRTPKTLHLTEALTVGDAIADLPRVRSGLSERDDSASAWIDLLRAIGKKPWMKDIDTLVAARIRQVCECITPPKANRGGELIVMNRVGRPGSLKYVFNHTTRSHIDADMERYLYASSYAREFGKSPTLHDFPAALFPDHESARRANLPFKDRFKVQMKNAPANTITSHISKDGHYYIHYDPTQCRSLTVREAARLQTFPDDYLFCGPRTSQYQQVGNAVPPVLGAQLAEIVFDLF